MNQTLDEYRAYAGSGRPDKPDRQNLERVRQAAVKAELLVGDPNWDMFLSMVQAALETTQGQREQLISKLANPSMVNHEEIMQTKLLLAECQGTIGAWTAVLSLPGEIMKNGDKARIELDRIDDA